MTALPQRRSRLQLIQILCFIQFALGSTQAWAVPSFAQQTGQPCAACHVGAFGPQLTRYGRDFKLNGYLASDGQDHGLPIAATTYASFTRTDAAQPAAPHFARNDNVASDQTSLYYAGRVTPWLGAFAQVTYDGVARQYHWDNTDIRYAHDGELFGADLVYGFTANNAPTVSDLWNSTPVWGFPYNRSRLAPTPQAATLIDGGLGQHVAGAGGYVMWNDLLYLEADLYGGLGYGTRNAIGIVPVSGTDKTTGPIPYWRVALQQDLGRSYIEFGTYGLAASVLPGGVDIGRSDRFTDTALDVNYQFTFDPKSVTGDMISAHSTLIHENASLHASQNISGTSRSHTLDTFRADVSYSIAATVTPSVQYFWTGGTKDLASYNNAITGSPNSSGMIAEIAYVPWGKPGSLISWGNIRLALQYIDYVRFDGSSRKASANNGVFASVWFATHF